MNNHIDQLAQWWENADQVAPMRGDLVIENISDEVGQDYRVRNWPGDMREKLSYVRVLEPKPKPAWHDAVAVMARCSSAPEGHREPFIRSEANHDVWVGEAGHARTGNLRDVTPLIEAKVTDEMVERGAQASTRAGVRYLRPSEVREVLTAALGLETE